MDILELVDDGAANVALHNQSNYLRSSAEAFLDVYNSHIGYSVVAASPQAERVLGAVMMLRPEISAAGRGETLIFDVNVASGTLIARAAQRLRDAGNTSSLTGVALHSLVGVQLDRQINGLSALLIVDPASSPRQTTERCDRRVQLAG